MGETEDRRFDLMHRIHRLKRLMVEEILDSETTKVIMEQISEADKELKVLSNKK